MSNEYRMRVNEILAFLKTERDHVDEAIAALEILQNARVHRRGRKSMPPGEREQVSLRMKRYWANQRQAAGMYPDISGRCDDVPGP